MEKSQTDGYYLIFSDYVYSSFRDFESYFRIVVRLDEDVIQLILKEKFQNLSYEKHLQVLIHLKNCL